MKKMRKRMKKQKMRKKNENFGELTSSFPLKQPRTIRVYMKAHWFSEKQHGPNIMCQFMFKRAEKIEFLFVFSDNNQ